MAFMEVMSLGRLIIPIFSPPMNKLEAFQNRKFVEMDVNKTKTSKINPNKHECNSYI